MDYDDAYLMHHGVKGMKWGVRRYRNYDGTLTNAGKAQRHKQSYKNGDSGRSGMSAKTKKRLATAAKVAGAAAAVGGAAYLANKYNDGNLVKDLKGGKAYQNASKKFNQYADKGESVVSNAKDRLSNSKFGKAVSNARSNASKKFNQYADKGESVVSGASRKARNAGMTVSGTARSIRNVAGERASNAVSNARTKLSNARTNAKNKFDAYAEKGQSVMEKRAAARSTPEARLKRSGNLVSSTSRIRDAASNARDRISGAVSGASRKARNAGMTVSGTARSIRNVAGEKLSNARSNASKKFNQYAEKGQSVLEKRAAARSTPEARLKRSGNLVSSTSKIRDAASNARDRISGAVSGASRKARNAGMTVSGTARSIRNVAGEKLSNARSNASKKFNQYAEKGQSVLEKRAAARSTPEARLKRSGNLVSSTSRIRDAASNARDRVSGAASNARDKVANSRVGKRIKADAEDIGKVASTTKSVVKSKYYTGTKSGRKKIADQTREAKHRTNQRRMYGAR